MKKFFKYFGVLAAVLVFVVLALIVYINNFFPNVQLQQSFIADPSIEHLKRGEYLTHSVTACFHCHSPVNFNYFAGKVEKGTEGEGGREYKEEYGFPGNFYSSNITPFNLKDWSDAEIYRAITSGEAKNGDPLFPLMPYSHFKYLTIEDAKSIIAYIRTIDSIESSYAKSEFTFPFSLILKTIPSEATPIKSVNPNNKLEYGKYLVTIAGCESCHTPTESGNSIKGMDFAGGFQIPMETGGVCTSANITPDLETGIGSWSKTQFIQRFKFYENNDSIKVNHGDYNSEMPWRVYSRMTEEDLGSIYDFLRTVKPVKNRITKFTP
jgi:hypothetical protein